MERVVNVVVDVTERVGDTVGGGDTDAVGDGGGDRLGDGDRDRVPEGKRDGEGLKDTVGDGVSDRVGDALIVVDGVAEAEGGAGVGVWLREEPTLAV